MESLNNTSKPLIVSNHSSPVRRRASAKTGKNGRPKEVGKGIGDFRMQVIKATRLNRRKKLQPAVSVPAGSVEDDPAVCNLHLKIASGVGRVARDVSGSLVFFELYCINLR
jgi:hypothetical protein